MHTAFIRPIHSAALIRFAFILALLISLAAPSSAAPAKPDFGPNVLIFNPSMPAADIQAQIDKVYAIQQHSEFGSARYAFLFLPGDISRRRARRLLHRSHRPRSHARRRPHHRQRPLRRQPAPQQRHLHLLARRRGLLRHSRPTGTMQWAVSQAVPFRRMHVLGNLVLHQHHGWASGGWISDSLIDGNVDSGSQQQWISRNSEWHSWTGANWNMVFVGVKDPPRRRMAHAALHQSRPNPHRPRKALPLRSMRAATIPSAFPPCAPTAAASPGTAARHRGNPSPSRSSFIAHPGDTAASLNAQLAQGKNLLFTPGLYDLTEPIRVTRPNTIVMGLGFATLRPVNGTAALTTADADGIILAGLLIDAGPAQSPVLLQVGPQGSHASHAKNPISLHDVFFREGGAARGPHHLQSRNQLATTPSSITPGSGAPITAPASDGIRTSAPTAWSSTATTSPPTASSSSITSNFRSSGTATAAAPTSINPKSPTTRPTRRATPSAAGSQRLGLLQSRGQRHHPRSLGPRHLLRLPPPQRRRSPAPSRSRRSPASASTT